ncbi:MAG: hypothetical protein V1744_02850 [Candidatus Altiarchaeota archaeon]
MKLADNVVQWYIKNVLLPQTEEINHPGFIMTKLSSTSDNIGLREIAFPESLFVELENEIVRVYGKKGEEALYSIGKKFGYGYANLSALSQLKDSASEKEFLNSTNYFVLYLASIFAGRISHKIDLKEKKFEADMTDYIICRKNGKGFIMSIGGSTGIWCYLMDDMSIEGVQTRCMGRGDEKCHIQCSPPDVLKRSGLEYFVENNLPEIKRTSYYEEMNKVRPSQNAKNSLEDLLNTNFFEYSGGKLSFKGERYFICEAHLMYLLEKGLQVLPEGDKILFDVAFNFGKKLAVEVKGDQFQQFMMDFLPALGFGDVLVTPNGGKYEVISSLFPWTEYFTDLKFTLFRGVCSGMLSGFTSQSIVLDQIETSMNEGYLDLVIK